MGLIHIRKHKGLSATYTINDTFIDQIDKQIKIIVEAGARDLIDALQLELMYPCATIYSFECNPECVAVCENNLSHSQGRIKFNSCAASNVNGDITFFSFNSEICGEHDAGVSSIYQHKDTSGVPMKQITVPGKRIEDVLKADGVESVDLLCLDMQGGELNLLLGLGDYINKVKYIIIEFENENCYINAPTDSALSYFLTANGFRCTGKKCFDRMYVR